MASRLITIICLCLLLLVSCGDPSSGSGEVTTVYKHYAAVECEIIDIDVHQWYASTHHYRVDIEVQCDELADTHYFEISSSGAMNRPWEADLQEGDKVIMRMTAITNEEGQVIEQWLDNDIEEVL